MKIEKIIKQPEGRRLEFKEQLPSGSNLARTVIAFSNDAGGEVYLGVQDEPREIAGLDPDTILQLEERISSMVFDQCDPVILPEFIIDMLRNNTPYKNHALHLTVPHPQFSRISGDNSTTHTISP